MTDLTADSFAAAAQSRNPNVPKDDWPLMADILSHRAGIPEHLIRWRRAEGNPDPDPQP
jgi:hypothetical protein